MRSDYSEEAVGSVPRSLRNDRDVRIADNAAQKTRHEFFMSHLRTEKLCDESENFRSDQQKIDDTDVFIGY